MQLNPRYGTSPIITLDGVPSDIVEPTIRQRRRLAAAVAGFDEQQWSHPSRCEGWSNRDVVVHLDSTNFFWAQSIAGGCQGTPTKFLATFDPVTSPAELVAASTMASSTEVHDRFVASTEALVDLVAALDGADWDALAESPPGHVAMSAVLHHALWDAWVHERDILLPMGAGPDEEPDEVAACLRYAAGLGPALALDRGRIAPGSLSLAVTEPDLSIRVDIGDHVHVSDDRHDTDTDTAIGGDAIDLLEALSMRAPLPQPMSDEWASLLRGIAEVFDIEEA